MSSRFTHNDHRNSDQMSSVLGPAVKKVLPKNYHRENMQNMKAKQQQVQTRMEEQENFQPSEWKMKRFEGA